VYFSWESAFDRMGFGSLLEENIVSKRVEETATHSMQQADLFGVVGSADNSMANGVPWLIQQIIVINQSPKNPPCGCNRLRSSLRF
jgi:hypothetical protein